MYDIGRDVNQWMRMVDSHRWYGAVVMVRKIALQAVTYSYSSMCVSICQNSMLKCVLLFLFVMKLYFNVRFVKVNPE